MIVDVEREIEDVFLSTNVFYGFFFVSKIVWCGVCCVIDVFVVEFIWDYVIGDVMLFVVFFGVVRKVFYVVVIGVKGFIKVVDYVFFGVVVLFCLFLCDVDVLCDVDDFF